MIAVDTNVLVRLVMRDDEPQAQQARQIFDTQSERNEVIFISDVVLVEFIWVLRSRYKQTSSALLKVLHALLNNTTVQFQSDAAVREAVQLFEQKGVDFPDCLVVTLAKAHYCESIATFDQGMRNLPGVNVLS